MKRFVEGQDRRQSTLLPACLDDYVAPTIPCGSSTPSSTNLTWRALGFAGVVPEATGRPAYHPATLLKIYIYGYLNRIPSSRRLERETQRNLELMWLTGRLMPDFKTIADFRRDNGPAIRAACAQFVGLCRKLNLFSRAVVAIDGSKFKAVNNRDKNFTPPSWPSASSRSRPASHATSPRWTAPTGRVARRPRPGTGSRTKSRALREQMQSPGDGAAGARGS